LRLAWLRLGGLPQLAKERDALLHRQGRNAAATLGQLGGCGGRFGLTAARGFRDDCRARRARLLGRDRRREAVAFANYVAGVLTFVARAVVECGARGREDVRRVPDRGALLASWLRRRRPEGTAG
jgi:hypothetical protein